MGQFNWQCVEFQWLSMYSGMSETTMRGWQTKGQWHWRQVDHPVSTKVTGSPLTALGVQVHCTKIKHIPRHQQWGFIQARQVLLLIAMKGRVMQGLREDSTQQDNSGHPGWWSTVRFDVGGASKPRFQKLLGELRTSRAQCFPSSSKVAVRRQRKNYHMRRQRKSDK